LWFPLLLLSTEPIWEFSGVDGTAAAAADTELKVDATVAGTGAGVLGTGNTLFLGAAFLPLKSNPGTDGKVETDGAAAATELELELLLDPNENGAGAGAGAAAGLAVGGADKPENPLKGFMGAAEDEDEDDDDEDEVSPENALNGLLELSAAKSSGLVPKDFFNTTRFLEEIKSSLALVNTPASASSSLKASTSSCTQPALVSATNPTHKTIYPNTQKCNSK
jgi:hypothetical protein